MYLGLPTHVAEETGNGVVGTLSCRTAANTSPGRAPRGHLIEHRCTGGRARRPGPQRRSFIPQAAQAISLRGNGIGIGRERARCGTGAALEALLEGFPALLLSVRMKSRSGSIQNRLASRKSARQFPLSIPSRHFF